MLTGLFRRHLGANGLLLAFVAVDAVDAVLVLQLAGAALIGWSIAIVSLVLAAVGFRRGVPPALRIATLIALAAMLLAVPQLVLISEQTVNSPLHDGILLTDAAGARLLAGLDPYGHDYIDSLARTFYLSDAPVNFGLAHYVYMPGMVLLDVPIRALAAITPRANFSWMFLPGLVALGLGAWSTGRTRAAAEVSVIAVVLNPLFQVDYLYFLNDLLFLAPLLAAAGLLMRGRAGWAGILFGVALSIKQQAVLLLPLALLFAYLTWDARQWRRGVAGAAAVVAVVVLPFVAWNPVAFIRDTAAFFYGSGVDAYPIRGLGLPGLLLANGVIANRWAAYPLTSVLELLAAVVVIATAVIQLRRRWTWPRFWLWNALLAGVVFFFGRVLSPNYLDLVASFALLGLVSGLVEEAPVEPVVRDVHAAPGDGRVIAPARVEDAGHLSAS